MSVAKRPTLAVFSNVTAITLSNGNVVLAGRLISGMQQHAKDWPGDVLCVCEPAPEVEVKANADRALGGDNVVVAPGDLPFELAVVDFRSEAARRLLSGVTIAIAGIGYRATHLSAWGLEVDVPVIYGSEYSLKTRLQVEHAEVSNPLRLARRIMWQMLLEREQRSAIRIADGIQCNGTPTYDAYKAINRNAMLFFDGRMHDDMLVTDEAQIERHKRMLSGAPLRLAWSGRLNKMKGANYLPAFAEELKKLGVSFQLEVFGGGVLEESLRQDVIARGLQETVHIRGYVDFAKDLTPHMQTQVDVWICPHVQGDPAGAFLEAFGSGLPIIGFDTEALTGLLRLVDAGATVTTRDVKSLAARVAQASSDRDGLVMWSKRARAFAAEHTFDKSFYRRMVHIEDVLRERQNRVQPRVSKFAS